MISLENETVLTLPEENLSLPHSVNAGAWLCG